jgi:hypothetical protein
VNINFHGGARELLCLPWAQFQNFIRIHSVLGPEETANGLSLTGTFPINTRQTGSHLVALNEMPLLLPHQEGRLPCMNFSTPYYFRTTPL